MKQTIKIEVELDENHLPENISMQTTDAKESNIKSLMISLWQAKKKETLKIDLWTKDMPVYEMFIMYHQTLTSMANSLERATGEDKLAAKLKEYCSMFAKETKILNN
jgi:gliding motility-associated protein GldC|tara:strand:- start:2252 stop:2572 length:321 start_codon:yes stop_codon:yes gene_type:complete